MPWLPTMEVQDAPWTEDKDILTEDLEHADLNNSTHNSDATVALGGPEAVGHPEDPVYDYQDRLTAFTREINDLHQRVAAGEGQPAETLDCIQCELQNLLIAIHQPQPPAPAEPLKRSNTAVHGHPVFNAKIGQPHKLLTARYTCFS